MQAPPPQPPASPPGDFGGPPGQADPPGFATYAWPNLHDFGAAQVMAPGYPPPLPKQTNSFAVVSLIAGVVGILGSCACFVAFPASIAGVVSGLAGLRRVATEPERYGGRGLAMVGIGCSVAGIAITLALMLMNVTLLSSKLGK